MLNKSMKTSVLSLHQKRLSASSRKLNDTGKILTKFWKHADGSLSTHRVPPETRFLTSRKGWQLNTEIIIFHRLASSCSKNKHLDNKETDDKCTTLQQTHKDTEKVNAATVYQIRYINLSNAPAACRDDHVMSRRRTLLRSSS